MIGAPMLTEVELVPFGASGSLDALETWPSRETLKRSLTSQTPFKPNDFSSSLLERYCCSKPVSFVPLRVSCRKTAVATVGVLSKVTLSNGRLNQLVWSLRRSNDLFRAYRPSAVIRMLSVGRHCTVAWPLRRSRLPCEKW